MGIAFVILGLSQRFNPCFCRPLLQLVYALLAIAQAIKDVSILVFVDRFCNDGTLVVSDWKTTVSYKSSYNDNKTNAYAKYELGAVEGIKIDSNQINFRLVDNEWYLNGFLPFVDNPCGDGKCTSTEAKAHTCAPIDCFQDTHLLRKGRAVTGVLNGKRYVAELIDYDVNSQIANVLINDKEMQLTKYKKSKISDALYVTYNGLYPINRFEDELGLAFTNYE